MPILNVINRTRQVNVMVDDEEWAAIERAAAERRCKKSQVIRDILRQAGLFDDLQDTTTDKEQKDERSE